MSRTTVTSRMDGPLAWITFATVDGLNVFSSSVLRELEVAVLRVADDPEVRATVITAEGRVFMAGADIKEMASFDSEQARGYGFLGQGVFNAIAALPSITVAGINGAALGGGLEMALACDFRIAVKSAKLGLPEVSLGLVPGWGGIGRLTKLVGPAHAKRLILSGLPMSAEDGLAIGLVDEIVNAAEDVAPRITAFCRSFRKGSPAGVRLAKRAMLDMDELSAFADCFAARDAREGIAAFIAKRPAKWME